MCLNAEPRKNKKPLEDQFLSFFLYFRNLLEVYMLGIPSRKRSNGPDANKYQKKVFQPIREYL